MPLLTDINELKTILEIAPGDTSEDAKLMLFISYATSIIEEFLNRPGLFLKERTEYYNGTGTAKLLLRSRPVLTTPTIQCWVSTGGYWGQGDDAFPDNTELVYGSDFVLQIDTDDGKSRSGLLWTLRQVWPKPNLRQVGWLTPYVGQNRGSIKIVYTAGYTVQDLPGAIREACNLLVMRLYQAAPYGALLTSESYEERSVSYLLPRDDLLSLVRPLLWTFRNFRWGI